MTDHHTQMLNDALAMVPAAAEPHSRDELKAMLQRSVLLAALENVAKFETEPSLKAACRARFLDLTDGKAPQ